MKLKQNLLLIGIPLASIVLALLVGAILIIGVGEDPINAYAVMIDGAFGDWRSFTDTLVKTTPLVFTGLSFAFAAKCNIWNIGAEGQLYMGALASVAVGIYAAGLPTFIHLPLSILAGACAGAGWAGIVAWLKIKRGINEVVTTIMMNYIAILIASALVYGPMLEDPYKSPQTKTVLESAILPVLFDGTNLHAGFLLAIGCCIIYTLIFKHMNYGYQLSAVGLNREAARFSGMAVNRKIVTSLLISGAFAGLAGVSEMLGTNERLIIGFSPDYGSDGIAVALLGQLNAVGVFLASLLFGALRLGATTLQRRTMVPQQIVVIVQGIIILFAIAGSSISLILKSRIAKKEALKK